MSWLGFNTAVSGLMTSQRKIHIANHNIASSEREGFSKQAVYERSNTALRLPGTGYIGTGNQTYDVKRVRDEYIDFKFRKESSPAGEWEVKRSTLTEMEGILKGTKEHGINISIDELFSSLEDLSLNPSDNSNRMSFRQKAEALVARINETAQSFNRQQVGLNTEVASNIKEVNDLADQISNINGQIFRIEIDGRQANDLRDQRDLLVDKMSELVDIDTAEINGKFMLKVGGTTMVEHEYTKKFKYPPATEESTIDPTKRIYKLEWEDGDKVSLFSGELKGVLDARDGNGIDPSFKGVPYYVERLDEFASTFAKKLNEIFETGVNANGNSGMKLFTVDKLNTTDYNGLSDSKKEIRAINISVSKDVMDSLDNIVTGTSGLSEDNGMLRDLIAQRKNKDFFNTGDGAMYSGTPEDFLTSIISTLGTESQYADRMDKNQKSIMENIENQRMSTSGVDLNEEMNGVIKFQQLYAASAKMVTVFDEIMDATINRLGIVGR